MRGDELARELGVRRARSSAGCWPSSRRRSYAGEIRTREDAISLARSLLA